MALDALKETILEGRDRVGADVLGAAVARQRERQAVSDAAIGERPLRRRRLVKQEEVQLNHDAHHPEDERYLHLSLIREEPNPPRRKRQGFPQDMPAAGVVGSTGPHWRACG